MSDDTKGKMTLCWDHDWKPNGLLLDGEGFWMGHDAGMPNRMEVERLAACWNACVGAGPRVEPSLATRVGQAVLAKCVWELLNDEPINGGDLVEVVTHEFNR